MPMNKLAPECNLTTLTDGRGGIFTYYPQDPIVEWNLLFTHQGESRGFHFHKEFDEYVSDHLRSRCLRRTSTQR